MGAFTQQQSGVVAVSKDYIIYMYFLVIYRRSLLTFDLEESLDQWFSMEVLLAFRMELYGVVARSVTESAFLVPTGLSPSPQITTGSFRFRFSVDTTSTTNLNGDT